ncbi:MAG: thioredoxin family protein [Bacteroidetes bacterium]|nr:MAG: thioredoxin family protein [Bacteroidota bacterium]
MRLFSISLIALYIVLSPGWETDFESAKQKASEQHKYILLNFSGSDWCGPCIRMHKEIFESDVFKTYADANLVLLNADFPRLKKNQLSKEQQKKNDLLADKYNTKGSFPLTVLLAGDGSVIYSWDGMPDKTPDQFVKQLKEIIDARK